MQSKADSSRPDVSWYECLDSFKFCSHLRLGIEGLEKWIWRKIWWSAEQAMLTYFCVITVQVVSCCFVIVMMMMMMMMMMDELTLTWHIVLRLQGHVTVKKESCNSRRAGLWLFVGFLYIFIACYLFCCYLCTCWEQVLFLAESVRLSVRTKFWKLPIRNLCSLVGIWIMVVGRWWHLTLTFDLENYFRI